MRITAETKETTRHAILAAGRKLFSKKGFERTTTRDISAESGIAAGTLFNYFPNKESLAIALVLQGLDAAVADFRDRFREMESLDEELFLVVSSGLRRIAPQRGYIGPVLETLLSPMSQTGVNSDAEELRINHLQIVAERLAARGIDAHGSFVTLQLYWALYIGVLAFWAGDTSPNQEDTLALLDQSIRAFVASLSPVVHKEEVTHG